MALREQCMGMEVDLGEENRVVIFLPKTKEKRVIKMNDVYMSNDQNF